MDEGDRRVGVRLIIGVLACLALLVLLAYWLGEL
jgi:hypothetical protein